MTKRAAIIVLDGLGIGPAPDTAAYGDAGSDTLGNVARAVGGLKLPNLEKLGLGKCRQSPGIPGLAPGVSATAAYGIAQPASAGKDSTTGHWEMCGVLLEKAFRTYPKGFPVPLLDEFARRTGRGWLGNKAASGTAIIDELGAEHQRSGKWIVYTSADSVFQIAAHEATVPLAELYRACTVAREMLMGDHAVSRVIARPFAGTPGAGGGGGGGGYRRTAHRKDFSIAPAGTTLLDRMADAGVARIGIGKVDDLFAGRNISSEHTPTNSDAYRLIEQALDTLTTGFVFVNVIEFDQTWGHRNDVPGFHQGLKELDAWLPRLLARLRA
ncbi:MAG TPA: phosphopentomutase, partial [Gemmatimonadales bacterium]|nr:phosphopentomutase [Gemmatimonadales bacterium]